ncbi:MAG: hypothetical protein EBS30_08585, partial [Planctomycetes bacterium]|nr:hypothetical protein [Planctomycetota bacterium]
MATAAGTDNFYALESEWRARLSLWATSGLLEAAALEALNLRSRPSALEELIAQWAKGDFSALPPIELLPASSMPGAAGAYAISTGTIYMNQDWLAGVSNAQAFAVLTEELGHHLDVLLNAADTPGDEGLVLARLLEARFPDAVQARNGRGAETAVLQLADGTQVIGELASVADLRTQVSVRGYTPQLGLTADSKTGLNGAVTQLLALQPRNRFLAITASSDDQTVSDSFQATLGATLNALGATNASNIDKQLKTILDRAAAEWTADAAATNRRFFDREGNLLVTQVRALSVLKEFINRGALSEAELQTTIDRFSGKPSSLQILADHGLGLTLRLDPEADPAESGFANESFRQVQVSSGAAGPVVYSPDLAKYQRDGQTTIEDLVVNDSRAITEYAQIREMEALARSVGYLRRSAESFGSKSTSLKNYFYLFQTPEDILRDLKGLAKSVSRPQAIQDLDKGLATGTALAGALQYLIDKGYTTGGGSGKTLVELYPDINEEIRKGRQDLIPWRDYINALANDQSSLLINKKAEQADDWVWTLAATNSLKEKSAPFAKVGTKYYLQDFLGIADNKYTIERIFYDYEQGTNALAIALRDEFDNITIVFRGTDTASGGMGDIYADASPYAIGDRYADALFPKIYDWLKKSRGSSFLNITGHSLGGAIAQQVAAKLTQKLVAINTLTLINSPGISIKDENPLGFGISYNPVYIGDVNILHSFGDVVGLAGRSYIKGNRNLEVITAWNADTQKDLADPSSYRDLQYSFLTTHTAGNRWFDQQAAVGTDTYGRALYAGYRLKNKGKANLATYAQFIESIQQQKEAPQGFSFINEGYITNGYSSILSKADFSYEKLSENALSSDNRWKDVNQQWIASRRLQDPARYSLLTAILIQAATAEVEEILKLRQSLKDNYLSRSDIEYIRSAAMWNIAIAAAVATLQFFLPKPISFLITLPFRMLGAEEYPQPELNVDELALFSRLLKSPTFQDADDFLQSILATWIQSWDNEEKSKALLLTDQQTWDTIAERIGSRSDPRSWLYLSLQKKDVSGFILNNSEWDAYVSQLDNGWSAEKFGKLIASIDFANSASIIDKAEFGTRLSDIYNFIQQFGIVLPKQAVADLLNSISVGSAIADGAQFSINSSGQILLSGQVLSATNRDAAWYDNLLKQSRSAGFIAEINQLVAENRLDDAETLTQIVIEQSTYDIDGLSARIASISEWSDASWQALRLNGVNGLASALKFSDAALRQWDPQSVFALVDQLQASINQWSIKLRDVVNNPLLRLVVGSQMDSVAGELESLIAKLNKPIEKINAWRQSVDLDALWNPDLAVANLNNFIFSGTPFQLSLPASNGNGPVRFDLTLDATGLNFTKDIHINTDLGLSALGVKVDGGLQLSSDLEAGISFLLDPKATSAANVFQLDPTRGKSDPNKQKELSY